MLINFGHAHRVVSRWGKCVHSQSSLWYQSVCQSAESHMNDTKDDILFIAETNMACAFRMSARVQSVSITGCPSQLARAIIMSSALDANWL